MAPFSAHVAFFVVARFSFAFAFAVDLAFALALNLCCCYRCCFCSCFCFSLCFCLCSPRPSELFSEVIHDPRLVRVQIGLDDRSQLVVVTLKLLSSPANDLAVSVGIPATPR